MPKDHEAELIALRESHKDLVEAIELAKSWFDQAKDKFDIRTAMNKSDLIIMSGHMKSALANAAKVSGQEG